MTRFIHNRMVVIITLVILAYWPIAFLVPQEILVEMINGLIASLSMGLVVAYAPGIWAMTRRLPYRITGADMLVIGIVIVQLSLACLFAWAWWYRYLDAPLWMDLHAVRGWIVYILAVGGVLHLLAADVGVVNNSVPEKSWMHLGLMVAAGLAIGTMVLTIGTAG